MENKLLLDILDLISRLKFYTQCDDVIIFSKIEDTISMRFTWMKEDWNCQVSYTKTQIEQVRVDLVTGTVDLINQKKRVSGLFDN